LIVAREGNYRGVLDIQYEYYPSTLLLTV
jgi:hypothetical protein